MWVGNPAVKLNNYINTKISVEYLIARVRVMLNQQVACSTISLYKPIII